jgi:predicted alpha/beta superfamily hydrolase
MKKDFGRISDASGGSKQGLFSVVAILLSLLCADRGQAANVQPLAAPVAGSERPASMVFTEQFLLRSEAIGQTFLVQVARALRPPSTEKTPVIYAVDGMLSFGLLTSATRAMPGEGLFEPSYVVAIGYPEEDTAKTTQLRLRDLMHRSALHRSGQKQGGGGGAFEKFLLEEVKPLIESRYPVDPKRSILLGFSVGGLFTANVLANHPESFSGYVIGSPSVHYDDAIAGAIRKIGERGQGRRVFIGVGELEPEMIPRADELQRAFDGSKFLMSRKTFAGETHTSVIGALASHGLRFVLGQPAQ